MASSTQKAFMILEQFLVSLTHFPLSYMGPNNIQTQPTRLHQIKRSVGWQKLTMVVVVVEINSQ